MASRSFLSVRLSPTFFSLLKFPARWRRTVCVWQGSLVSTFWIDHRKKSLRRETLVRRQGQCHRGGDSCWGGKTSVCSDLSPDQSYEDINMDFSISNIAAGSAYLPPRKDKTSVHAAFLFPHGTDIHHHHSLPAALPDDEAFVWNCVLHISVTGLSPNSILFVFTMFHV